MRMHSPDAMSAACDLKNNRKGTEFLSEKKKYGKGAREIWKIKLNLKKKRLMPC